VLCPPKPLVKAEVAQDPLLLKKVMTVVLNNGLAECDKQLWKNYPHFKVKVMEVQKACLKV
jgi:hypothetical protein